MWKARETELAASSSSINMRKHSPLVRYVCVYFTAKFR